MKKKTQVKIEGVITTNDRFLSEVLGDFYPDWLILISDRSAVIEFHPCPVTPKKR